MNIDSLHNFFGPDISSKTQELFGSAEVFIPRDKILRAVDQLAIRLTVAFRYDRPVILFNLKDAGWLFGCLIQRLQIPVALGCFEIEEDPEDDKLAWRIRPTVSVENEHILFVFGDLKNTHEKEFVSNWSLKHGAIKILNASLVIRAGDGLSSDRRYSCFSIGQESLVGCGLSLDGHGSNLPDLYSLDLG